MELHVLGSGGWLPTERRETSAYAMRMGSGLLLLEAGSGLRRLGEHPDLLEGVERVDVALSHYHLDHVVGLGFLPNWIRGVELHIHGPGPALYDASCESILTALFGSPHFSLPLRDFAPEVHLHDVAYDELEIPGVAIRPVRQDHTDPSLGFTVGNFVHLATDTTPLEATFIAAADVEVLLHECWTAEPLVGNGHSSAVELARLWDQQSPRGLRLLHVNPNWTSDDEASALAAFSGDPEVRFLDDGDIIRSAS